jgi:hypothetical protein
LMVEVETSGSPFKCARSIIFTCRIHLVVFATAAFVHGALDFFPGLACALLDTTDQFNFLALGELQVVFGELRKFLFQLALGNVPVSFGGKSTHIILRLVVFIFLPCDSAWL